jgi:hypothetical protein
MLMAIAWGSPVGGIQIGASVAPTRGTFVQLVISIKNGSNQPLHLVRTAPLADYKIAVTDTSGSLVPISLSGQHQTTSSVGNAHFRRILVVLPVKKTRQERYDLTSLFHLKPGSYKVAVTMGAASSAPAPFGIT